MGRHSAAPRDTRPQLQRLARNSVSVVVVTLATMALVMASIASYAYAKSLEVPLPTMALDASGSYAPIPDPQAQTGAIPDPTIGGADTTMRQCPATGCSAPTCHAETGEPIPGRQ